MQVGVRALRDGEEDLVQQVFDGMSAEARFLRFHAPVPRLLAGVRASLARRVPGEREPVVALVDGRAVGLGHWVRDPADRGRAELSVAVTDDVRGRGVGRGLARALAVSAAASGVRRFECHLHSENRALRDRLRATGGRPEPEDPRVLLVPVGALTGAGTESRTTTTREVGDAWFDGRRGVRRAGTAARRACRA